MCIYIIYICIYIYTVLPQKTPRPSLQDRVNKSKTEESQLKPIEPIESSIGAWIQDSRSKSARGSCSKHLGSRLKPIEPIETSIGAWIQDPRVPVFFFSQGHFASWMQALLEISIGSIGFNRDLKLEGSYVSNRSIFCKPQNPFQPTPRIP